jgi:hypothetical protein
MTFIGIVEGTNIFMRNPNNVVFTAIQALFDKTLFPMMSMPDALPTEIALITLLLSKFQVYSTFLHHYYHRLITLSTFRLLYQSTIHHMALINTLRLPLKKFFCP